MTGAVFVATTAVLTDGEVTRGVGGALLVVQQREGVQLVGGAGREVAHHVAAVTTLDGDVAGPLASLRQRDHLSHASVR